MTDTLTVIGVIGTEPRSIDTSNGTSMTTFRLASAQRRYDRAEQRWVDGSTNWYTVTAFNGLAGNALASLARGDRIVVTGRLGVRAWEAGGKSGTDVVLTAEGIGHDLAWGTTRYTKTVNRTAAPSAPVAEPGWSDQTSDGGDAPKDWAATPEAQPVVAAGAAGAGGVDPSTSIESVGTPF